MNLYLQPRLGLSVVEAGWILQKTEAQVCGMLRRGELRFAVSGRKIDPAGVDVFLDSELDRKVLEWLLLGLIVAPKPLARYGPPADLMEGLRRAALRSPALVQDSSSGRVAVVPRLADALGDTDSTLAGSRSSERVSRSLNTVISFIG